MGHVAGHHAQSGEPGGRDEPLSISLNLVLQTLALGDVDYSPYGAYNRAVLVENRPSSRGEMTQRAVRTHDTEFHERTSLVADSSQRGLHPCQVFRMHALCKFLV